MVQRIEVKLTNAIGIQKDRYVCVHAEIAAGAEDRPLPQRSGLEKLPYVNDRIFLRLSRKDSDEIVHLAQQLAPLSFWQLQAIVHEIDELCIRKLHMPVNLHLTANGVIAEDVRNRTLRLTCNDIRLSMQAAK